MRRAVRARALALAGALALTSGLVGVAAVTTASPAAADTPSQKTVAGTGDFADLRVTVSQTEGLINQVVRVGWTGGTATRGNFAVDYLQIMQCWGDDAPTRETCQFGGLVGDQRGGPQVSSRQLTYSITDPQEELKPTADKRIRYAPFKAVDGTVDEGGLSQFFDQSTTNEVPYGLTRSDGTGEIPFEVQTSKQAPGLGCGERLDSGKGRGCWLVVVPRGEKEVDGSERSADTTNQLISSPLSQTNWDQRLVVPLSFVPVDQPCPIGRAEQPIVGNESAVEAISSWQPLLCEGTGPVFSYSELGDTLSRRQLIGDKPGLSVTTLPVPASQVPAGRTIVKAPLAVSGLTIAYNIESNAAFSAPDDVKARNGVPITDLVLTQRLVLKLLTQSYRQAAAQGREGIEKNPQDLTRDPEFRALNPVFTSLSYPGIADITVPAGTADTFGTLWAWIFADPKAAAFAAGRPDEGGMVVNPAYKGISQQDGFPKSDTACTTFPGTSQPQLCTLDANPYAADGHEAARGAARGDDLARSFYDQTATPPTYKRQPPQPTGSRAVLALADTATATRFGLFTARLPNASGTAVAPSADALVAAVGQMRAGSDGTLTPVPTTATGAAYPLTTVAYGQVVPSLLTAAQGKAYGDFLAYAADRGQVSGVARGQLPAGYAPLTAALKAQTRAAAVRVAKESGVSAIPPAVTPTASASPGTGTGGGTGTGTGGTGTSTGSGSTGTTSTSSLTDSGGLGSTPVTGPTTAQVPGPRTATTDAAAPAASVLSSGRTPTVGAGAARLVLPLVLLVAILALVGTTGLQRRTRRTP